MVMPSFIPFAVVIGVAGTKTSLEQRHLVARKARPDPGWWLLLVVAWLPMVCWVLAQFLPQY
jgi:hypothetical protein